MQLFDDLEDFERVLLCVMEECFGARHARRALDRSLNALEERDQIDADVLAYFIVRLALPGGTREVNARGTMPIAVPALDAAQVLLVVLLDAVVVARAVDH